MTQLIEQEAIVNFAKKHFNLSSDDLEKLKILEIQLNCNRRMIFEIGPEISLTTDLIVVLATWFATEMPGINIGIAGPNLISSYAIREKIFAPQGTRQHKISNKDTIVFYNDSKITVLNHNRIRGQDVDILFMHSVGHIIEGYLSMYMTEFSRITECGGKVVAFCDKMDKVKTTYFPTFSRLSLITAPAPE